MIYFVTENYIKEHTAITANCDVKDIMPFIATNSDMWAQSVLGSYFYEYLLTKYNAQTLSAAEEILVAKIQPLVAWRAASDAVFALSRKLKNKGIQRQDGEYSSSVELNELSFAMRHYSQKAEFYTERLRNFLKENKADYAEFIAKENKDSDIKPSNDKPYGSSFMFI